MTKRRKDESKRKRVDLGNTGEGATSPFAVLANSEFARQLPKGHEESTSAKNSSVDSSASGALNTKLLLRFQRKGFGGKSATIVEGVVDLGADNDLLKEMAKSLGTRANEVTRASLESTSESPEELVWVLGGDQRDAAKRYFEKKGYRNVEVA